VKQADGVSGTGGQWRCTAQSVSADRWRQGPQGPEQDSPTKAYWLTN